MGAKREKVAETDIKKTAIMLEALEDFQDRLSRWEKDEFLPSVTDWFYNKGWPLTEKQFACLEKIYRRYY